MNNELVLNLESLLVAMNQCRGAEWAFAWQRAKYTPCIYIWPATGNHTVWADIMQLALSVDDFAHPELVELVDGRKELVISVDVYEHRPG